MSHLGPEELIDLAEGSAPVSAAARAHLDACGSCQGRIAEVRATLAAVRDPDVRELHEPSPLYWDHFSARVQEAIAEEGPARAARGPERWFEWKLGPWASWRRAVPLAACLVALLAVAITLRPSRRSNSPAGVPSQPVVTERTAAAGGDIEAAATAATDDSSWNVMTDLARDLDWDGAVEAGLAGSVGGVDRALFDLSAEERRELQRLLKEELSRSGA